MDRVFKNDQENIQKVNEFLLSHDLSLDDHVEEIYVIKHDGKLVATGCIEKNVLKCIAVDSSFPEGRLINLVMGHLIKKSFQRGHLNLYIYTKPEYETSFGYFGFKRIVATKHVVLLENEVDGLKRYLSTLNKHKKDMKKITSVVMNANPFTNGHKHLVSKASNENDWVHVFVVWEDLSTFPNDVRFKLICEGLSEFPNVTIHKGLNYVISSATFPSYFIKDQNDQVNEQANLDLTLFGEHIGKSLGITSRYVGTEPFNETTNLYNKAMKVLLPQYGIEVIEINRLKTFGSAISASKVRALLNAESYDQLKALVPDCTYEYLISNASKSVLAEMKKNYKDENLV